MNQICSDFLHSTKGGAPLFGSFSFYLNVFFEVLVGDLIEIFELAIVISFLLNGIVGEVDVLVVEMFEVVLFAGGANIALLVPVALHDPVYCCD